jgi:hypothetical protein
MKDIIFFDNAATSRPKPEEVPAAMIRYLCGIGGRPGRSGNSPAAGDRMHPLLFG